MFLFLLKILNKGILASITFFAELYEMASDIFNLCFDFTVDVFTMDISIVLIKTAVQW